MKHVKYYSSFHVKVVTKLLKKPLHCSFSSWTSQSPGRGDKLSSCSYHAGIKVSCSSQHRAGRCSDGGKNTEKLRRMAELNVLPPPCSSRPGFQGISEPSSWYNIFDSTFSSPCPRLTYVWEGLMICLIHALSIRTTKNQWAGHTSNGILDLMVITYVLPKSLLGVI